MSTQTKFGDWTATKLGGKYSTCQCVCGTVRRVPTSDLRKGKSKSCGCTGRVRSGQLSSIRNRRHGMDGTPTYRSWVDMKRRCHNPKRWDYANYGARGIVVCERWRNSFDAFLADMGPRPEGFTLDRIDNAGPYSPENCRWIPRAAQERNKRTNRWISVYGVRMTIVEASERYGIHGATIITRLSRGWDETRAATQPAGPDLYRKKKKDRTTPISS